MGANKDPLLIVKNLKKYFPIKDGFVTKAYVQAVDDVSFVINKGETMGLVGESGCGKSTTVRTIMRLNEPTDGEIWFDGNNLTQLKGRQLLPYRKRIQMIFQDPYASLNGRMTVGDIIGEALDIHKLASGKQRTEMIHGLLHKVGLAPDHAVRYPHEFSGGQRQRIGIARALAVSPDFIICDEPISALDVSIQAQIINMLKDLQRELGLTYLFIAHDLSMVRYLSDKVGVMYLGKLVETAESEILYKTPLHPYTQTLLSSIPIPDPNRVSTSSRVLIKGDIADAVNPPVGCRFNSRCRYADSQCAQQEPEMREISSGHYVACHAL